MKVNIKALELIEKGLSSKTVGKLTESQINVLHSKLFTEVTMVSKDDSGTINALKGQKKPFEVYEKNGEVKETETDDVDDKNALGADSLQGLTGQDAPHDANDMAPDGMDNDSDDDREMMGMSEEKKKSKKDENNPWAICTSQLGKEFGTRERNLWSAKENNKYERCVKDVKKSLKEQKNPVSLFLENEIIKIVERNLPPKITKKELMNYLNEAEPAVAPTRTKPTTKPGTRPSHPGKNPNPGVNPAPKADDTKVAPTRTKPTTKPGTRPSHPGKNPNPGVNPAPKANKPSPEQTKDKVLDVILQILNK
jgi:hypothetical protein